MRSAIAAYVQRFSKAAYGVNAPPIGIYCAGRFCQLIKIPQFQVPLANTALSDIMTSAHAGYSDALKATGNQPSKLSTFPAFLGLCLMDATFVCHFSPITNDVKQVASEFGIDVATPGLEWKIATAFVKTPGFTKAVAHLMGGNQNPWLSKVTLEQVLWWSNSSQYAIP